MLAQLSTEYLASTSGAEPFSLSPGLVGAMRTSGADLSPEGIAHREKVRTAVLRKLDAVDARTPHDRVSKEYFGARLSAMQDFSESGEELRLLSDVGGPLTWLLESFMQLPLVTREDWETVLGQVQAVPGYLAAMQSGLEEGMRRGVVANRSEAENFADRCTRRGGRGALGLFRMFYAEKGVPPDLHDRLYDRIQDARDAVENLGKFVRDSYLPVTQPGVGVGAESFMLHAAMTAGGGTDYRELYDWAWYQIEILREVARRLARKEFSGRSIEDVIWKLDADSGEAFGDPESSEASFLELLDTAFESFDTFQMPDDPLVHKLELASGWEGWFKMTTYSPAPREGQPARVWLPDSSAFDFPAWRYVGPFHFVTVPGLHLLVTNNRFITKNLTDFQRITMVPAHAFGWGMYVERLLQRVGYLSHRPGWEFGGIQNNLLRTCRLIVDTGLHLGFPIPKLSRFHPGESWTVELAVEFLDECTFAPRKRAEVEVRRAMTWPSQLSSYKVGERAWTEGLDECRAAAPELSELEIHTRAIALGPLTVDQMRRELPRIADPVTS